MRKGVWLKNLMILTLEGDLKLNEAFSIFTARIKPKPTSIQINGVLFQNVDQIMWGIIADIYLNRVYTPSGMEIRSRDVIVDVGAHRGAFTSFAASQADTTVISFEPPPENYRSLLDLIRRNSLKNVAAHNLAVGAKSGKARLFLSAKNSRHSLLGKHADSTEIIEVDTLSLDD